ncbi:MAG: glycosyltransferase family A protein [Planctomycetota bacterium]
MQDPSARPEQRSRTSQPAVSVLIPSRGRSEAIGRLLKSLEQQTLGADRFEIIVGVDGSGSPPHGGPWRVERFEHRGPAATRNSLVRLARGEYVLFLNDDVSAHPGLLEAHLDAHAISDRPSMILGSAPFAVPKDDRLFDRLVRETSMVFFYNTMNDSDPERDWGFRHAWTLNLSLPTALAHEHSFNESFGRAMFEDLEWAWRVQRSAAAPVLYRPAARVTHHHRYEPRDYLARERELGRQAVRLAEVNAACAGEIFRRDPRDLAFVAECRARIERDAPQIEPLIDSFRALADMPSAAAGDPRLIRALYEHHLPLKRHLWRHGLVEASWSRERTAA